MIRRVFGRIVEVDYGCFTALVYGCSEANTTAGVASANLPWPLAGGRTITLLFPSIPHRKPLILSVV